MVRAYHLIITTYGFWLPNDPRGAWSDFVGGWELFRYGPATKTDSRRSVARESHDWRKRREAKSALKHPAVSFTGEQALAAVKGFAAAAEEHALTIWACAILPEHVHFVIARHADKIEWIGKRLKIAATKSLRAAGLHPFESDADEANQVPSAWAKGRWKVFLNTAADILRAIRYVELNPEKEGKRRQQWRFVQRFVPAA